MKLRDGMLSAAAAGTVVVLGLHIVWPQPGPDGYWPWPLGLMAFPVAAALILTKRPGNGVGRVLGVVALASLVIFATWWHVGSYPTAPSSAWVELLHAVAIMPQFAGMVALLYVFPSGRPVSSRQRAVLLLLTWWTLLGMLLWLLSPGAMPLTGRANPVAVLPGWTRSAAYGMMGLFLMFAVGGVASLVARWRRARSVERAQLRWFIAAAVLTVSMIALVDVLEAMVGAPGMAGAAFRVAFAVTVFWSLPAAVVMAVTRYRLYEIDRLISRTVTYAVVVAALLGTYAGGVLLIGSLLPVQSELAVAASTLAAAALFNPLRQRVQQRVDRRFNRDRYDAARVASDFRARLRDEVDLDDLSADLLSVVAATVRPAAARLWIREAPR